MNAIAPDRPNARDVPDASRLAESLQDTSRAGRQTLVILGAGCSVAAGMPQMRAVYDYLLQKVRQLAASHPTNGAISDLLGWLESLQRRAGPRSAAAKALGTLQTAHSLAGAHLGGEASNIASAMAKLWDDFSIAFIAREIGGTASEQSGGDLLPSATNTQPLFDAASHVPGSTALRAGATQFHRLVGEWTVDGRVFPISVNFDGLTRDAVRACMSERNIAGQCVILNAPDHVERFFLGDAAHRSGQLFPVVKVWGDVFHAVCHGPQCPEFGKRIPIYDLSVQRRDDIPLALNCPICGASRQLQVYFPGYQKKEEDTGRLMESLWRYVAPGIGSILVAGLSGIWDDALLGFVAALARDLQSEGGSAAVFCVDPDPQAYLPNELRMRGIEVRHIVSTAEGVADQLSQHSPSPPSQSSTEPASCRLSATEDLWKPLFASDFKPPHGYTEVIGGTYLYRFQGLRQLGLKTRLLRRGIQEEQHNRYVHSLGTCHLAMYWVEKLLRNAQHRIAAPTEVIRSLSMLAAMHHDLGHVPFTHLTEEVFDELHWTVDAWSGKFRHDLHVFDTAWADLSKEACSVIHAVAKQLHMPPDTLQHWVARSIEGRSGIPLLDGVLNSPLDVDKIDYVFRDCKTLGQAVHLPVGDDSLATRKRIEWVKQFVDDQQEVLPSGIVALSGTAGEHAREMIEERRWLYKHLYFKPAFRMVERIARSVLTLWLGHVVPKSLSSRVRPQAGAAEASILGDVRALKGQEARTRLWDMLTENDSTARAGEPGMIVRMIEELEGDKCGILPMAEKASDWVKACGATLRALLAKAEDGSAPDMDAALAMMEQRASRSERLYVRRPDFEAVAEIIRAFETSFPFTAMFDVAYMPPVLAYPKRRRFSSLGAVVTGECFAVPHSDPDRWGRRTGRWVPLADTAYAETDDQRWAQIIVVSPRPDDSSHIRYAEDRFRSICAQNGIKLLDEDPDGIGVTRMARSIVEQET